MPKPFLTLFGQPSTSTTPLSPSKQALVPTQQSSAPAPPQTPQQRNQVRRLNRQNSQEIADGYAALTEAIVRMRFSGQPVVPLTQGPITDREVNCFTISRFSPSQNQHVTIGTSFFRQDMPSLDMPSLIVHQDLADTPLQAGNPLYIALFNDLRTKSENFRNALKHTQRLCVAANERNPDYIPQPQETYLSLFAQHDIRITLHFKSLAQAL